MRLIFLIAALVCVVMAAYKAYRANKPKSFDLLFEAQAYVAVSLICGALAKVV